MITGNRAFMHIYKALMTASLLALRTMVAYKALLLA